MEILTETLHWVKVTAISRMVTSKQFNYKEEYNFLLSTAPNDSIIIKVGGDEITYGSLGELLFEWKI